MNKFLKQYPKLRDPQIGDVVESSYYSDNIITGTIIDIRYDINHIAVYIVMVAISTTICFTKEQFTVIEYVK